MFSLALVIFIFHTQGDAGYCEISLRRVHFIIKTNYFYWYLGFHRNFSVTKIPVMKNRYFDF